MLNLRQRLETSRRQIVHVAERTLALSQPEQADEPIQMPPDDLRHLLIRRVPRHGLDNNVSDAIPIHPLEQVDRVVDRLLKPPSPEQIRIAVAKLDQVASGADLVLEVL